MDVGEEAEVGELGEYVAGRLRCLGGLAMVK